MAYRLFLPNFVQRCTRLCLFLMTHCAYCLNFSTQHHEVKAALRFGVQLAIVIDGFARTFFACKILRSSIFHGQLFFICLLFLFWVPALFLSFFHPSSFFSRLHSSFFGMACNLPGDNDKDSVCGENSVDEVHDHHDVPPFLPSVHLRLRRKVRWHDFSATFLCSNMQYMSHILTTHLSHTYGGVCIMRWHHFGEGRTTEWFRYFTQTDIQPFCCFEEMVYEGRFLDTMWWLEGTSLMEWQKAPGKVITFPVCKS